MTQPPTQPNVTPGPNKVQAPGANDQPTDAQKKAEADKVLPPVAGTKS